ncbi:MAG TPA: uridine kinase [Bdellovibrionota bacterium]|nr:uridine kinase [Bdellovibrionota bacterium]
MIIGVAGGSGSGKTTLAHRLYEALLAENSGQGAVILGQDHYYIDQSARFDGDGGSVNFDHPSAIDSHLLGAHIRALGNGQPIEVPRYDFATHSRLAETVTMSTAPWVIVEGTMILHWPEVRDAIDYKIFISVDEEVRYARRLYRDTHERGRSAEGVLKQFTTQVKPMHDAYVDPSAAWAEVVIGNDVSTQDLLRQIKAQLKS